MESETHARVDALVAQFYAAKGPEAETIAAAIVACVQPSVRAFLAGEGRRGADLDDLCQNTDLRLLQALRASQLPDGRRIRNGVGFARAIARNLLIDTLRTESTQPPVDSLEDLAERSGGNPDAALPVNPVDVEATVVAGCWFRDRVWPLVCDLRPQQRAALLLGLRQDELLLLTGKISAVARTLDIPLAEFLAVWRDLPLSDPEIARRLGIAAEGKTTAEGRVSNLRKCALERIARHLAKDRDEDMVRGGR